MRSMVRPRNGNYANEWKIFVSNKPKEWQSSKLLSMNSVCWFRFFIITIFFPSSRSFFAADLIRRLRDYQVVVPRKVSHSGQVVSRHLKHDYDDASRRQRRRRRQTDDANVSDDVHYRLELSGREKHLHLKPNDGLLASSFVVERRRGRNVTDHRLKPASQKQCHYVGQVKGHPESTVAVSTCHGLVSRHNRPS